MKATDRKWFEKYLDSKFTNIDAHFKSVNTRLDTKASKKDVTDLRAEVRNIKLTSAVVGAFGGLMVSIGSYFSFLRGR